jgi:hypothetical protein
MMFVHLKRILGLGRLRLRGPNGAKDELRSVMMPVRTTAELVGALCGRSTSRDPATTTH